MYSLILFIGEILKILDIKIAQHIVVLYILKKTEMPTKVKQKINWDAHDFIKFSTLQFGDKNGKHC